MRIFKISSPYPTEHNTYDSAVVLALSADAARNIHPNGGTAGIGPYGHDFGSWVAPSEVQVEFLGIASAKFTTPQVLVASFNAG